MADDDEGKKKHTIDTLFHVYANYKVGFVYEFQFSKREF